MTRKELCNYLTGDTGTAEIIKFKQCLECDEVDQIDNWLAGVINSLYYRPNKLLLVICGEQGIGKTELLRRLFPIELHSMYSEVMHIKASDENLYEDLLVNCDEVFSKNNYRDITKVYSSDCKRITLQGADKRLASITATSNSWDYPQRKTVIVLNLKSINKSLFNSIDKKKLWQQIYNRFKQ